MSLQEIAEELLEKTSASRTTIRLGDPNDPYFPVKAEALVPGIRPIIGETNYGILEAPTFLYLKNELKNLIQRDVLESPPVFPDLVEIYGIRSQILAPIVRDGRLAGIVSVHHAPGPRDWTEEDLEALEEASRKVYGELEQSGWAV